MNETEFYINDQEWQEFQAIVQKLEASETDNFCELVKLLGRDPKTDLVGADLRGANLQGADLSDADLSNADLVGADLRGANFQGADLSNADLSNADLVGADLRGANFQGADLSNADLGGANLSNADLSGANLQGTIFDQVADSIRQQDNSLAESFRRECLRRWLEGEVSGNWQTEEQLAPDFRTRISSVRSVDSSSNKVQSRIDRVKFLDLRSHIVALDVTVVEETGSLFGVYLRIYPVHPLDALPIGLRITLLDKNGFPEPGQEKELNQPQRWIKLPSLELESNEQFGIRLTFADVTLIEQFVM